MGWGSTEARRYFPPKKWSAEVLGWRHDFEFTNLRSLPFFWVKYRGYDVGLNLSWSIFQIYWDWSHLSLVCKMPNHQQFGCHVADLAYVFHAIFELNLCSAYRYIQDSSNQMVSENYEIMNKGIQSLPSRIHSWSLCFENPVLCPLFWLLKQPGANLCPSTSKWVSYHEPYSLCIE